MDIYCLACGHGPHKVNPCSTCGCKTFINAELQAARGVININNALVQELPVIRQSIIDLVDLMCCAFPEAEKTVRERRETAYKKQQERERKEKEEKDGNTEENDTSTTATGSASDNTI